MSLEIITQWWNEYYPVIVAIGGTILTVGGIIFTAYIKFKPIVDGLKTKFDVLFNKATDVTKEDITNQLQMVNVDKQITDLKEKINNPLTSDDARIAYTKQLEVLLGIKTKLENGLATVEDTTSKF